MSFRPAESGLHSNGGPWLEIDGVGRTARSGRRGASRLSCRPWEAVHSAYLSLTKPRLVLLVLATVAAGFFLGARASFHPVTIMTLAATLLGTALVAGGAGALNQWLESARDARMRRTANRALPSGRIAAREAALFGSLIAAGGHRHPAARSGLPGRGGRVFDVRPLCLRLHAAEDANDPEHLGRRGPRRLAALDRLGRGGRPAGPGSLVAVPHRFSLAVPSLPRDCLDLSRGLPARRFPDADGRKTLGEE